MKKISYLIDRFVEIGRERGGKAGGSKGRRGKFAGRRTGKEERGKGRELQQ